MLGPWVVHRKGGCCVPGGSVPAGAAPWGGRTEPPSPPAPPSPPYLPPPFRSPFFIAGLERRVGNGVKIKQLAAVSPLETLLEQCHATAIILLFFAASSSKRERFGAGCGSLRSQLLGLLPGHRHLSELASSHWNSASWAAVIRSIGNLFIRSFVLAVD